MKHAHTLFTMRWKVASMSWMKRWICIKSITNFCRTATITRTYIKSLSSPSIFLWSVDILLGAVYPASKQPASFQTIIKHSVVKGALMSWHSSGSTAKTKNRSKFELIRKVLIPFKCLVIALFISLLQRCKVLYTRKACRFSETVNTRLLQLKP